MISEPAPENELEWGPLWNAYCSLLTFFFYCSFADQFTSYLVTNQDFPGLFAAFEVLFQVSRNQVQIQILQRSRAYLKIPIYKCSAYKLMKQNLQLISSSWYLGF
jgi:hypothetical protein